MRRACLYCGENHGPGKDCKEERQQKEDRKHNESLTPDPELENSQGQQPAANCRYPPHFPTAAVLPWPCTLIRRLTSWPEMRPVSGIF